MEALINVIWVVMKDKSKEPKALLYFLFYIYLVIGNIMHTKYFHHFGHQAFDIKVLCHF